MAARRLRWCVRVAALVVAGAGTGTLAACGGSAPPQAPAPRPTGQLRAASRIRDTARRRGSVVVRHVRAPGFATPREVWEYVPPVPDPSRLPIVYFLHGQPGAPHDVFTDADLAASMDDYVAAGGTPFIVAAVDGRGERRADTEWANAVDGTDPVETAFLRYEIPAVEGAHRRDPGQRAIAGYSMGGYGAVNIGLRHHELFGQVVSLGGYFHVDDPDGVLGRGSAVAYNTPDRHAAALRGQAVLLVEAIGDTDRVTRGETRHFAGLLRDADVPFTLELLPGGHTWAFVRSALPGVESFLAAHWTRAA